MYAEQNVDIVLTVTSTASMHLEDLKVELADVGHVDTVENKVVM